MSTRTISLTPEQDDFINAMVNAGAYRSDEDVIRDALGVLQQHRRETVRELESLRIQVRIGIEALDRGAATEIGDTELDGYLDALIDPPVADTDSVR